MRFLDVAFLFVKIFSNVLRKRVTSQMRTYCTRGIEGDTMKTHELPTCIDLSDHRRAD